MDKVVIKIRKLIEENKDEKYREFAASLLPGVNNLIGVRLPVLRNIAKEVIKEDYKTYLDFEDFIYFEEIMIKGFVIGLLKEDIEIVLSYVEEFIPHISNWSVCDSFCSSLKITKENKERVWQFLNRYLKSDKAYDIRFAVVMMLWYYVDEEYIDKILLEIDKIDYDHYYVKMAVAWAISMCYVKFPERTLKYLKDNNLDDFTYNKALQKICESLKIDKETKNIIRKMKRG